MDFEKTVLDNGLRVIVAPQKDNPAVTVLVLVSTGSKYETKEINGISHFLEHMCFKGTKKRPAAIEISSELDSLGASYNAFTSQEWTGYYAKVDKNHFEKALDVVSDIYLNQIFDTKEIDKERGVIIEELNMYEDLPMRRVAEYFMELLYGDQPAGWEIGGKKEVIRKLDRDDFIKYKKAHYVASATTVVIAGAIDKKLALERVRDIFAGIAEDKKKDKMPIKESQTEPKLLFVKKETDQTHLILGVRAYDALDKRRHALNVLANILGGGMSSRLFQIIRDELGAAYYVRAEADKFTDHGFLATVAGVDNAKMEVVVEAILGQFRDLKKNLVNDKELQKAKDNMVGRLMLGLETSDALAGYYGEQEILTGEPVNPDEVAKKIKNVKAEDIRAVAQDIFQNNKLNLAIIGPKANQEKLKSILKID
ncbi:MAG: hypothetical protein COT89_01280 [Candidatus Colwellbacteria bacterium CG10_big_fil_rev_8_21_14_0_10_42_22]|uniref:Peptidase M16 n=1 Tax=Candidatus Colwellbacteria bacterium CG10_big_fil_rev_8_21_14_0_10_42_22 TaxID=1974540 RepID=A0A2H0VG09_9BACT|nr:MAG: hypothetical protein COT89_01280 [Candidatus Colwellbacteria bacterium CG10_big_fil_rev_8_21_14_0_10_42_22]